MGFDPGLDDLCESLPTQNIQWFCDFRNRIKPKWRESGSSPAAIPMEWQISLSCFFRVLLRSFLTGSRNLSVIQRAESAGNCSSKLSLEPRNTEFQADSVQQLLLLPREEALKEAAVLAMTNAGSGWPHLSQQPPKALPSWRGRSSGGLNWHSQSHLSLCCLSHVTKRKQNLCFVILVQKRRLEKARYFPNYLYEKKPVRESCFKGWWTWVCSPKAEEFDSIHNYAF